MRVEQRSITGFLGQPEVQFVIPVYQRVYSWRRPQLSELWTDLMHAGKSEMPHFMGTVFYSEEDSHREGLRQLDIIDGQQRMTTFTLLICALCKHLLETGRRFNGLDAASLEETYLKPTGCADACKLVLSRADAPTLRWIEGLGDRPESEEEYSELVVEAYEWFLNKLGSEGLDWNVFQRGFEQLYIVSVQMEDSDRSSTVFESLNAKGKPLSTPDLVRNYLLMRPEFDGTSYLYDTYWAKVEDAFSVDPDDSYLAHAIRLWSGSGTVIKDDKGIFDAFKSAFSAKGRDDIEKRAAYLSEFCIAFHEKIAAGDEEAIKACREWEENRGKAERLGNGRKIFGD